MALLTSTSLLPWGSRVHDDDCGGTLFHRGLPPNNPFTIKSKFRWFQGGKSQNLNAFGDSIEKDDQALKKSSIASCLEEPQEYRACTRRQMYRLQSFERENPMVPSTQRRFLFIRSNFLLQMSPTTSHICGLSRHSNTVPFATRGPKELHVTCTELLSEDGLLKKQGLQAWEPEMKDNDLEGLLCSTLPTHPKLYRGQLYNGIHYVILPNKVPPNRFEAHMEIHVGSVDEGEDEQGIAHMIEHVAFLGSKKREKLLSTGARCNAYTDFHHTVFHIHSPSNTEELHGSLLPFVLEALQEIAFQPKFLPSRVEKERQAILSELQMMNTIEYRVDCQLLQHLHSENKLGCRFPIGLEEQIKKWDIEAIKRFYERWYFPANATLYIVGDIGDVSETVYHIDAVFGLIPPALFPKASESVDHFPAPKLSTVYTGGMVGKGSSPSVEQTKQLVKERQARRPPVKHNWSLPVHGQEPRIPHIFQHELLQNFSIHLFCKTPVSKVQTYGDLRNVLMKKIVLSTLHFRINTNYKSSNPPFTGIMLDHSDSGREGCTVTTLTVTAEPRNWRDALKVSVQQVRRLKEFGITKGELERYMTALLKDSERQAAMIDNVSSINNLNMIMECDSLSHTVMDQQQGHESLIAVAQTVTLEDVNATGAMLLQYISDFGKVTECLPSVVVACVPKTVHEDGIGDTEFKIVPDEITEAMIEGLNAPIHPEPELDVPNELISLLQLEKLRLLQHPTFVPVHHDNTELKVIDKATGIVQLHLSNGVRVNYKITQNEAKGGVMRLVVSGGRASETAEACGAVAVGVRTLSESGTVGSFSREQVELFSVNHLINCTLEANEEFIYMDFHFTLREGGMQAAFQILHMVLEHSVWLEDAFHRATQLYLSYYRSMPKSLERATAHHLMLAMLKWDERFVAPSPQSIQSLTLQAVKDAVLKQFVTKNMEVSIVGDFTQEDIEACVLDYLGTITPTKVCCRESTISELPIRFQDYFTDLHNQQVFLKDTDERARAYIAGLAPNRWGFTIDGKDLINFVEQVPNSYREEHAWPLAPHNTIVVKDDDGKLWWKSQKHPLHCSIMLSLLAEILNSRLFTTVRDSLGLTYDVSFELCLFDRLKLGWFVISVTSTPNKIYKAVDASIDVLRGLHSSEITQQELDTARRTLLMRHESDSKENSYWLSLMTHLQAPYCRKDITCIRDLPSLYEAATVDDVYDAYNYLKIDDDSLFTSIGVAGSQNGTNTSTREIEEDGNEMQLYGPHQDIIPLGRGLTTMTHPTT